MLFARADLDQAIAAFERSSLAAERGAYPLYVARAYARLALIWACPRHDAPTATRYDRHAQAVMAGIGGDALAETWRLTAVACLRDHESDYEGATDAMSRALAVYTKAYGRDAVYATLLATLGSSLERDPARALQAIDEAIATQESLLGRHHPKLAYSLIVRAQQLVALGRYDEAETASRRALAIRLPTVTRADRLVGSAYLTLARALEGRGDLVAAADAARKNLEVREAIANRDPMDVLWAKVVTAEIVVADGHAKDVIPQLENDVRDLAAVIADNPDVDQILIDARLVLGRAYLAASRPADAMFEQALAGATTRKDPRLIAESRFGLAQARGSRELAVQARDAFAALPNPVRAAAVTRWLDK